MIGELWWRRLVNSVRFLDDIQDAIMDGKSVMLHFDSDIPWQDIMIETLEQRLSDMTDSRTFDTLDVSEAESSGTFLMERYCSREERKKYWPTTHGSPERFLAQNRDTPLNNRFVCITGTTSETADKWAATVTEYLASCDAEQEHGIFLLPVRGAAVQPSEHLMTLHYSDYVSDYDCMMLCLTLVSSLSCSRAEKMYLCEAASNIAHNQVELAAMLVSEQLDLIREPFSVTVRVYQENGIKVTELYEQIRVALWEAQIKLVFPILENFRADLIRKYESKLIRYLPIRSSNNDRIDRPADLEIGQLYFICKNPKHGKLLDATEFNLLKKMRDARNTLAHWEPLKYSQLKDLGIL